MSKRKKTDPETRFWGMVNVGRSGVCWLWKSLPKKDQPKKNCYPNFWDGKRQVGANRYSLELKIGRKLHREEFACHTCDNKRCVNPNHLFVGSGLDNSRDMVKKGRKEKGSQVYGAKLTEALVLKMRNRYARNDISLRDLSKLFDVTEANTNHVIRGKTWKHVGGPIDERTSSERRANGALRSRLGA